MTLIYSITFELKIVKIFYRNSNERLAKLEQKEESVQSSTPVFGTPRNTSTGLAPKELKFATPIQTPRTTRIRGSLPPTPSTPQTPQTPLENISDIESGSSVSASSLTPDFSALNMGKKCGRPRKQLEVPSMDDFPVDGDPDEKTKYIRKKTTEMWHFKKLSSKDSAEYRKKEAERVRAYQKKNSPVKG